MSSVEVTVTLLVFYYDVKFKCWNDGLRVSINEEFYHVREINVYDAAGETHVFNNSQIKEWGFQHVWDFFEIKPFRVTLENKCKYCIIFL